eukprot:5760090-Amphidinium_carterae.1
MIRDAYPEKSPPAGRILSGGRCNIVLGLTQHSAKSEARLQIGVSIAFCSSRPRWYWQTNELRQQSGHCSLGTQRLSLRHVHGKPQARFGYVETRFNHLRWKHPLCHQVDSCCIVQCAQFCADCNEASVRFSKAIARGRHRKRDLATKQEGHLQTMNCWQNIYGAKSLPFLN